MVDGYGSRLAADLVLLSVGLFCEWDLLAPGLELDCKSSGKESQVGHLHCLGRDCECRLLGPRAGSDRLFYLHSHPWRDRLWELSCFTRLDCG